MIVDCSSTLVLLFCLRILVKRKKRWSLALIKFYWCLQSRVSIILIQITILSSATGRLIFGHFETYVTASEAGGRIKVQKLTFGLNISFTRTLGAMKDIIELFSIPMSSKKTLDDIWHFKWKRLKKWCSKTKININQPWWRWHSLPVPQGLRNEWHRVR